MGCKLDDADNPDPNEQPAFTRVVHCLEDIFLADSDESVTYEKLESGSDLDDDDNVRSSTETEANKPPPMAAISSGHLSNIHVGAEVEIRDLLTRQWLKAHVAEIQDGSKLRLVYQRYQNSQRLQDIVPIDSPRLQKRSPPPRPSHRRISPPNRPTASFPHQLVSDSQLLPITTREKKCGRPRRTPFPRTTVNAPLTSSLATPTLQQENMAYFDREDLMFQPFLPQAGGQVPSSIEESPVPFPQFVFETFPSSDTWNPMPYNWPQPPQPAIADPAFYPAPQPTDSSHLMQLDWSHTPQPQALRPTWPCPEATPPAPESLPPPPSIYAEVPQPKLEPHQQEEEGEGDIRCICNYPYDSGLMMQCEMCKSWQHCECFNINTEEEVPEVYICYQCSDNNGADDLNTTGEIPEEIVEVNQHITTCHKILVSLAHLKYCVDIFKNKSNEDPGQLRWSRCSPPPGIQSALEKQSEARDTWEGKLIQSLAELATYSPSCEDPSWSELHRNILSNLTQIISAFLDVKASFGHFEEHYLKDIFPREMLQDIVQDVRVRVVFLDSA